MANLPAQRLHKVGTGWPAVAIQPVHSNSARIHYIIETNGNKNATRETKLDNISSNKTDSK